MEQWARALSKVDPELSESLDISRDAAIQAVADIGLPHYQRFSVNLKEFVSNPEKFLDSISSDLVYLNLRPEKGDLKSFRQPGYSKKGVVEAVKNKVSKNEYSNYKITVSEYYLNEFCGNIIVNPHGKILIEFKKGSQGPISDGSATPEFTVESGPTGSLKYSFEDENLRKQILSVLNRIPRDENKYLPGYYEFHLVRKDPKKGLAPIFIDYKTFKDYLTNN